jgi:hypothetical protein
MKKLSFQRPVNESASFIVVFDAASRSIALRRLAATELDFGSTIAPAVVDQWLANPGIVRKMP